MIPQSFIQDLLDRVDIVSVVGRSVQLKKGGANFLGLCPFHKEKSPSFTVSASKQFFHCFGCGASGSVLTFLMEYSGLSFVEAVQDLAQSAGLTVPNEGRTPEQDGAHRQTQVALTELLKTASDFYRTQLRAKQPAVAYLKGRGLTGEVAAHFGLGYAPNAWQGLEAVFQPYTEDRLVEAGLVIVNEEGKRYDRFRDRIMFPIRNVKGQIIGFGGRVLGQGEPKYLNSPETPVFNKGHELYGLFEARQVIRESGFVIVVEGYMDVLALAQLGFAQSVATLGTATTAQHLQKLFRHTDRVIFSFDGDAAGRKAAWRALEASLPFAEDQRTVQFLFLPPEHDPDTFIREQGVAAFEAQLKEALPLSAFMLRELGDKNDLSTAEGRAKCQYEAKPLLKALPAGALRLQILRGLADMTSTTPAEIEAWAGLDRSVGVKPSAKRSSSKNRSPMASLPARILMLLASDPVLADEIPQSQLERFDADPALRPLCALVDLIHESGIRHSGALSEAMRVSPHHDMWEGLLDASSRSLLSEPEEIRVEVFDALRQLELQSLEREIAELSQAGLHSDEARERFVQLDAERKRLKQPLPSAR